MTPKKKPEEKTLEVNVASVDPKIQEDIAKRAWKSQILDSVLKTIIAVASIAGPCWISYMQYRTRNAVIDGTVSVRAQTKQVAEDLKSTTLLVSDQTKLVADKLETSTSEQNERLEEHGKNLAENLKTSKANHDLINSLSLAMKKRLAEKARKVADLTKSPEDIAEAEMEEEAYLAHKKTHDEMQARDKSKEVGANTNG